MIPFPDKKYRTVCVDYPWDIKRISPRLAKKIDSRLSKKLPYKTMTDKQIEEFPLTQLMDENCDVFIWSTHTKLPFVFKLIKKLGLKYHCLLTWDKKTGINISGFTRNSEFVVYCYKGKMQIRMDSIKNIPTVFHEKATVHSRKPDIFYNLLLRSTREPRIDVFARTIRHGFDTWGDDEKLQAKPLEAFQF
jgi:N6-adenosine-specific RNA methylase IME4